MSGVQSKTMTELVEQTSGFLDGRFGVRSADDLATTVVEVASQLQAVGARPRTPVAYFPPEGELAAIGFLAAASAGEAAPINPRLTTPEIADYLEQLEPALLVVPPDRADELRGALDVPVATWEVDDGGALSVIRNGSHATTALMRPDPADVALILPTSGTTGRPKQVPLTHEQLLRSAENIATWLTLSPDDTSLTMMPLFHIHGLVAGVLAPLSAHGGVAVQPFDAFAFGGYLDRHRPSWFSAVPTMQALLVERWGARVGDLELDRLRFVRTSSSALDPTLLEAIEAVFGVPAAEAYGMTEASHQIAANPIGPGERRPGTVGLATGTEIRIDEPDEAGRGEVLVRAPQVTNGYRNAPEATATSFTDGWFRTGDEGRLDDGWLTLTGRLKEMINRGGEKVTPLEVETSIRSYPGVRDCAVFAVPHSRLGEEVGAAVVLDGTPDTGALRAYLRERLAAHKVPRHVEFVEQLPLGPTGKVQRSRLAEQLGL